MTKQDPMMVVSVTDLGGSTFTLREVCERGDCHAEFVIELVDYGIISPVEEGAEAAQWRFDVAALNRLRKALRLQRDLKINLPGLAMSLDLLDELQEMRREVRRLNQQLRQLLGD
ncbi:chaperone modulator CbpM [Marinobacter lutaoensis]|jgi:chaperone modulatory protein CbpM|uniref:Molecular chaperone n=1 Tax=Marinobacter lutaoensis TaxID=135739 RepID=A0A1V2DQY6_9GAMM|nr:chaperone modulator CbpM [Marinobacter lutaoensis]MBI42405.1 molecular chaperone [Oceanospirillales bacterium]NVD36463.1 chaperone modulator CbpM [Marinobacter lutaoensis]ONF43095.1 molecular chaperone [Marinobacter lutaoensis]|tara:strand:+ start:1136 stop:1480 length:345 start_codon:yes stop_codon:yes gene_type:complete